MTVIQPTHNDPLAAFIGFIARTLPSEQLEPMLAISSELLADGVPMPLADSLTKFVAELQCHMGVADNGN